VNFEKTFWLAVLAGVLIGVGAVLLVIGLQHPTWP
jgi:formate/nitrite transporter FocA (FNT family)